MIQDIAPHIYHNEYRPLPPDGSSYLLCFQEGKILLHQEGPDEEIRFPRFRDLKQKPKGSKDLIYLFAIDTDRFYLMTEADGDFFPGCTFYEIRLLRTAQPQHFAFAGITGFQLFKWYQSRKYCGCCGSPMKHSSTERQMYCPVCGHYEYPVLSRPLSWGSLMETGL